MKKNNFKTDGCDFAGMYDRGKYSGSCCIRDRDWTGRQRTDDSI